MGRVGRVSLDELAWDEYGSDSEDPAGWRDEDATALSIVVRGELARDVAGEGRELGLC